MVVRIVASSACGACAAKNYCAPSESKDKEILVQGFSGEYVCGERVKVVMQQSLGFRALYIGYIVPLLLSLASLATVYRLTGNELASGLSILAVLVAYYSIIKLLNQKIAKSFGFTVQKIDIA